MILAIRLNRKRLVVVLETELYIYDIGNLELIRTEPTSSNPNGNNPSFLSSRDTDNSVAICALSPSSENNYIAFPTPSSAPPAPFSTPSHAPPKSDHTAPEKGEVIIYDATKLEPVNVIQAHNSPLSCIAMNSDGTLLATASEKGTIIRVFSVPNGEKLYQFRRGSIASRIYSMSFNSASTLLCVSSASDTVHIFRLGQPNKNRSGSVSSHQGRPGSARGRSSSRASENSAEFYARDDRSTAEASEPERKPINPTFASMIRRTSQTVGKSVFATVGGYLPSAVSEMWEPQRDFAWVKIPRNANSSSTGPLKSVVAMRNDGPQIMVVTSDGTYYIFNIDLEKGGEGTLFKRYK